MLDRVVLFYWQITNLYTALSYLLLLSYSLFQDILLYFCTNWIRSCFFVVKKKKYVLCGVLSGPVRFWDIYHTCNVTIHANHETGYFTHIKLWQIIQFGQQIGSDYFGAAQKECCTENIFLSLPGKMDCQRLMIDICIVIQIVSLALNIRYRSIYNEFR